MPTDKFISFDSKRTEVFGTLVQWTIAAEHHISCRLFKPSARLKFFILAMVVTGFLEVINFYKNEKFTRIQDIYH